MMDGWHGDRDGHIDGCGVCAMEVGDPIYYYARGCVFLVIIGHVWKELIQLIG
jgi:hypothetical protein